MAKLVKKTYLDNNGQKRINNYFAYIPKEVVEKTGLDDKKIKITAQNDKIIIEKDVNC